MVGRTNALIGALVSSVNGMTGAVILNANIAYDPSVDYEENTIGDALKQGGGGGGAVQSVNGMTGEVVLKIGEALQDTVTREDLDDIRELPETSSAENGKVLAVVDGEWAAAEIPEGNLPPVTSADNGKVLGVVEGEWAVKDDEGGSLPDVTSADNGKLLGVVDGEWAKVDAPEGSVTIDDTLSVQGDAADAKAVGDALNTKIAKPATDGTNGQVLTTDGNGGATWRSASVDESLIADSVNDWIEAHPEAVGTVPDGSITRAKLDADVGATVDSAAIIKDMTVYPWPNTGYITTTGAIGGNADYAYSDFIRFSPSDRFYLTGVHTGSSSLGYAFYRTTEYRTFISGGASVNGTVDSNDIEIPAETMYVRFCTNIGSYPNGTIYIDNKQSVQSDIEEIKLAISSKGKEYVKPEDTTFFAATNLFDLDYVTLVTDRYPNTTGTIARSSGGSKCAVFPVLPNSTYFLYIPGSPNRGIAVENSVNEFNIGTSYTVLTASNSGPNPRQFTTGATAKFVLYCFYNGEYDWEANKSLFVLNKDHYYGNTASPFIPQEYLPSNMVNDLDNKQVLIFGDSITDSCTFTTDANNCTASVSWRVPTMQYVNEHGVTVNVNKWPQILKDVETFAEVRNYARNGATYKTQTVDTSTDPQNARENLQYQIDVALNDVTNPNSVFAIDNFSPDIIIFALGTNDGSPSSNDTYEASMAKTVFGTDGMVIDISATLAALDDRLTIDSAHKAFIRVKQAFPYAQIFVVLPIQRVKNDVNLGSLRTNLMKIAQRYGCIIIDGAFESGITREFNTWQPSVYLKDGLHPNEKGQNMMARMILSSLKRNYIAFGNGFNPMT